MMPQRLRKWSRIEGNMNILSESLYGRKHSTVRRWDPWRSSETQHLSPSLFCRCASRQPNTFWLPSSLAGDTMLRTWLACMSKTYMHLAIVLKHSRCRLHTHNRLLAILPLSPDSCSAYSRQLQPDGIVSGWQIHQQLHYACTGMIAQLCETAV